MTRTQLAAAVLAAVVLSVAAVPAHAGVFVGVGFGGPYYRPYYRPYWGHPYYRPYGVGVVVAPPPVVYAPPPPVVVQPAPIAIQTVPVTSSSAPLTTVPVTTAPSTPVPPPPVANVGAPRVVAESQPAIDPQLQALASGDERARCDAAVELGRMKAETAVDRLVTLLSSDPSAQVREAAARGLGLIGSPRALNALRYAGQADNDRDVRHSAQFAVEVITTNMRR